MAQAIGALRYDLIANVKPFMQALQGVRRDTRTTTQILRQSERPMDTYRRNLESIRRSYQRGKIDAEQYRRAVKHLKTEHRDAAKQRAIAAKLGPLAGLGTLGSLATGFSVVAILDTVRRTLASIRTEMAAIDRLAKTGRLLGLTTNELEALRLMGGEMAGMDPRQIDMALQRFTRRIAEAKMGLGEARQAIRDLGLDARQLGELDTAEQFREVARAMSQVGSEQERLRLAFKLFDSEGARLVLTMADNQSAMEDYERVQRQLGLFMSPEETAAIERSNDEWDRMLLTLKGIRQTLAVIVAGPLEQFAEKMQIIGRINQPIAESGMREHMGNPWLNPGLSYLWDNRDLLMRAFFPSAREANFTRRYDLDAVHGAVPGATFGTDAEQGLYNFYTRRQTVQAQQGMEGDQLATQRAMLEELREMNSRARASHRNYGSITDDEGNRIEGVD